MKLKALILSAMACTAFGTAQAENIDIFLEGPIEGTSQTQDFEGAIILNSLDMGFLSQMRFATATGSPDQNLSYCGVDTSFIVTKNVDISSPSFIAEVVGSRRPSEEFTITMLQSGGERPLRLMEIQLMYPTILAYDSSADASGGAPIETLSFSYAAIRGRVFSYDDAGRKDRINEFEINCSPA